MICCQKLERNPTRKRFERLNFSRTRLAEDSKFSSFTARSQLQSTILIHCLYLKEMGLVDYDSDDSSSDDVDTAATAPPPKKKGTLSFGLLNLPPPKTKGACVLTPTN